MNQMMDRAWVNDMALAGQGAAAFARKGAIWMDELFKGCIALRNPDLSGLNTAGVQTMRGMFEGCANLRRADLSTFDLGQIRDMRNMFSGCEKLEEVILPDTIRQAVIIPRKHNCPYTREELNEISKSTYISSGPQLAEMAVERAEKLGKCVTTFVPFCEAEEEEIYRCLGLEYGRTKITIVPYREICRPEEPAPKPEEKSIVEPAPKPEESIVESVPKPEEPVQNSSTEQKEGFFKRLFSRIQRV